MSNAWRAFGLPGKSASVCSESANGPEKREAQVTPSANRKAPKSGRLSSLIFRLGKSKSFVSDKRDANSDIQCRPAGLDSASEVQEPESKHRIDVQSIPERPPESRSRVLTYLTSRMQSSSDCSAQPLPRAIIESAPAPTSVSPGLDSFDDLSLCGTTISGSMAGKQAASNDTEPSASQQPTVARKLATPATKPPATDARAVNSTSSPTASPWYATSTSPSSPATPNGAALRQPRQLNDSSQDSSSAAKPESPRPTQPTATPVSVSKQLTAAAASAAAASSPRAAPVATATGPRPRAAGAAVAPSSVVTPLADTPAPTRLLAVCPGAPAAMQRPTWSLEDYSVQRRLYTSNTSAVYSAICEHSGLPVALKVYSLSLVPVNVIHMIWREIRIQSSLVHPHIVMLYGAFHDTSSQRLVLVEEFAANGDLHGVHRALGCRMSEDQARVLVLRPLLDAISGFHAGGIVHRDIKPENILFTRDWRLVLADFGVAINVSQERAVTRAGTVGYMAPEVERCPLKSHADENKDARHLAYSTAADVWAVGCLAYTLLLGFPPFISGGFSRSGSTLSFPGSTSRLARDFICLALSEHPADRPPAAQLARHAWLKQVDPQQQQQGGQQQGGQQQSSSPATSSPVKSA